MPDQKNYLRRTHFPDRFLMASPSVRAERETICKNCTFSSPSQYCKINDKFIPGTIVHKISCCPLGQWGASYDS